MPVVHPYHRSELLDISLRIVGTVDFPLRVVELNLFCTFKSKNRFHDYSFYETAHGDSGEHFYK